MIEKMPCPYLRKEGNELNGRARKIDENNDAINISKAPILQKRIKSKSIPRAKPFFLHSVEHISCCSIHTKKMRVSEFAFGCKTTNRKKK